MEPKEFATPFGKIIINRRVYYRKKNKAIYVPLDHMWGMSGEYATVEIREKIGYLTGLINPQAIADIFARFTPCPLSVSFIQKTGNNIGQIMEEQNQQIVEQAHKQETALPKGTKTIAVGLDGVNIMLREKGTTQRRHRTRPGHDDATVHGKSCYKNAGVGVITIYGDVPTLLKSETKKSKRSSQQSARSRKHSKQEQKSPKRLKSLYLARTPEAGMKTLKAELEAEIKHLLAIAPDTICKVILMDGARGLWKYITEKTGLFRDWVHIIDFHHACETLSKLAEWIFGKDSAVGKGWYDKYRKILLEQPWGVRKLIRSIDYHIAKLPKSKQEQKHSKRNFFAANARRMNYAQYRQQGMPIGSGPVEAGCKTIVKARLCCSGMRWTRTRAQHVLRIRTMIKNNRWDVAWNQCKYAATKAQESATN